MWTTPRSRSTAFERMMVERGDHHVFDEPFSVRYYHSAEQRSDRYPITEPDCGADQVLEMILDAANHSPVFVKEMAYYVVDLLDEGFLAPFTNTFLVREPVANIASFASRWPDITAEEAGFEALGRAFDLACNLRSDGSAPPVLEADDVARNPAGTISTWCESVGISYDPDALTWQPGMIPHWLRWREWYEGVAHSSGFEPPSEGHRRALDDPRLAQLAEASQPIYERLASHRIPVAGN